MVHKCLNGGNETSVANNSVYPCKLFCSTAICDTTGTEQDTIVFTLSSYKISPRLCENRGFYLDNYPWRRIR